MAEQNPLKPLFADIAAAIREKDGSEGTIPAENFPERIRTIPVGGLPEGVYTVNLEVSDPEGGTVTGGGLVQEGVTVTVTAAVGSGYKFTGWQENGSVVSEDEAYTFTVTGDRALVAMFEEYVFTLEWQETDLPSSLSWNALAYGNSKFVAIAYGSNTVAYSADGISWTEATMPSSANWSAVVYADGKFVAIATGSTTAAYSYDGVTWLAATLPVKTNWMYLTYGNGKFIALTNAYQTSIAAYSEDGISWTKVIMPSTSSRYVGIAYGNGVFVAIAGGMTVYSTDGITWNSVSMTTNQSTDQVIIFADEKFLYLYGKTLYSSINGENWEETALNLPENFTVTPVWGKITFASGMFVATVGGKWTFNSFDGINWSMATAPSITSSATWKCVAYGNGRFVITAYYSKKAAYFLYP